jgi:hypothetical protein
VEIPSGSTGALGSQIMGGGLTLATAFTVLCHGVAVMLLVFALRRRIWTHVGAWFTFTAIAYHGLGEMLNLNPPKGPSALRTFLSRSSADAWMWLIGPGILLFVVIYLAVLGRARRVKPTDRFSLSAGILMDPRVLAPIVLPLYALALFGSANGFASTEIGELLLLGVVLLTYAWIVDRGRHRVLHGVIVQSFALLLLGERLLVVAGLMMLLYALARRGITLSRWQLLAGVGFALISALLLSGARSTAGRTAFVPEQSAHSRIGAVAEGAVGLTQGNANFSFAIEYFGRLDGNNFAALALEGQKAGTPPPGAGPIVNGLRLAVPAFLQPGKLKTDLSTRNEEYLIESRYGMQPMNRLPTIFGSFAAYFGRLGFFLAVAFLAVIIGMLDVWLKRSSLGRLVIGVSLIGAVAFYERSPSIFFLWLRTAAILVVAVKAAEVGLRSFRRARRGATRGYSSTLPS